MKAFLFSLLLIGAAARAEQNRDVDLDQVNQVLNQIGASVIEGDDLFTGLSGEIVKDQTDLKNQKVGVSVRASASHTAWSSSETSMELRASFTNSGPLPEDATQVEANANGHLILLTPVVPMVKHLYALFGAECPTELSQIPAAWEYGFFHVCPVLKERVPALNDISDLSSFAVELYGQSKTLLSDYLSLMEKKLSENLSDEDRETVKMYIGLGQKDLANLSRLEVTNHGNALSLKFKLADQDAGGYEDVSFALHLSEGMAGLYVGVLGDFSKDTVDQMFGRLTETLRELQNRNQDAIADLTAQLSQYKEMVREFIQDPPAFFN